MRVGRRLLGGAIVAATGMVLFAGPAAADSRPGAYVDPGGSPTATASETSASGAGSSGGGGGASDCRWEVQIPDDQVQFVYEVDGSRLDSATGRWLAKICGAGELVAQAPEGGLVDVEALAREAASSVSISGPQIRTSPSAGGLLYVHIPTWLWIDGGWWRDYIATASTGRVTATVTATPTSVSWSTGDGSTISCDGPGSPWAPGSDDAESDCQHTYRRATDGQGKPLDLSATVTLAVSWTSSIGLGGTLDPISRTATVDVTVGEIQAIETE